MKFSGFLIIILLISSIIHGFAVKQIKRLYDENVILKNDTTLKAASLKTLQWTNEFAVTETRKTFEAQNSALKIKLDSLEKVENIKPEDVNQATAINYNYDNADVVQAGVALDNVTMDNVITTDLHTGKEELLKLPVFYNSICWSMKGFISTTDPNSKLYITERKADNSAQLVVLRPRRFLGFLWRTKKQRFKIYSDCGEATISSINFINQ